MDGKLIEGNKALNMSSLLRLFQSELFDVHLHLHYLHRMEQPGVQDYLVNELYKMSDEDIDQYLPQLCHTALLRFETSSLHKFLLDCASRSMHFALKIHWLINAVIEDGTPELKVAAERMVQLTEMAIVNSCNSTPKARSSGEALTKSSSNPDLSSSVSKKFGEGSPTSRQCISPPASQAASPRIDRIGAASSSSSSKGHGTGTGGYASSTVPVAQGPADTIEDNVKEAADVSADTNCQETAAKGEEVVLNEEKLSLAEAQKHLAALASASAEAEISGSQKGVPSVYKKLGDPVTCENVSTIAEMNQFLLKQRKCDFFNAQLNFIVLLMELSEALVTEEKKNRMIPLEVCVASVNRWLLERRCLMALGGQGALGLMGLHLPIGMGRDTRRHVICVHSSECKIFSSKKRAPFLLVYEAADLEEVEGGSESPTVKLTKDRGRGLGTLQRCQIKELNQLTGNPDLSTNGAGDEARPWIALRTAVKNTSPEAMSKTASPEQAEDKLPVFDRCSRCQRAADLSSANMEDSVPASASSSGPSTGRGDKGPDAKNRVCHACLRAEEAIKSRQRIWGGRWTERKEKLRNASSFGHYKSWDLHAVVVKGGDDVRQELLASQLVTQFKHIFNEACLPLWLRPYEVLITSADSGLIECVPDSVSVDTLKKRFPGKTLAEVFRVAFADNIFDAKQNFITSCAAYSLVCYFLQVRDRHNGNLLLDADGHLIHIDFGFMMSNSPGNVAFEAAPFKLTQEFLDVMDGECSDQYEYFRTLIIRGFLECRKHMERIMLLVRMCLYNSKLPCFSGGPDQVLQSLQDRFFVQLTDEACIDRIVDLIEASVNNWRTIQYDNYQRITNGIL